MTRTHTFAKLTVLTITTGLMASAGILGCEWKDSVDNAVATAKAESASWRKQSEEWQNKLDAAKNTAEKYRVESETWRKQFAELGKNMVDASDKLDPAGIKELFR